MLTDNEKQWLEQRGKPEGYDGCDFEPEDLYDDIEDIYLEVVSNWSLKRNKKKFESVRCQEIFAVASASKVIEALRDFKDAAEFEARVAAKLAGITESMMKTLQKDNIIYPCYACPANENCAGFECREALLRYARLAVEEEMNAES